MSRFPPISLRDLDAALIRRIDDHHRHVVDTIADADGIMFLCPACYFTNAGPVGTHSVICWFVGKVPDHETPGPGRWMPGPSSTGIGDLTFVPNEGRSHSVLLTGGCRWHGFITDGHATDV